MRLMAREGDIPCTICFPAHTSGPFTSFPDAIGHRDIVASKDEAKHPKLTSSTSMYPPSPGVRIVLLHTSASRGQSRRA